MADAEPERIDASFRNGTLTTCGVLVGFSLGFLSQWGLMSGPWQVSDLVAAAVIVAGIALQIGALWMLFRVSSLLRTNYERSVGFFMAGLLSTAAGVVVVLLVSLLGIGQHVVAPG